MADDAVLVVGAGLIGLCVGVRLLEQGGRRVVIVGDKIGARTTSSIAGAVWGPYAHGGDEEQTARWCLETYDRYVHDHAAYHSTHSDDDAKEDMQRRLDEDSDRLGVRFRQWRQYYTGSEAETAQRQGLPWPHAATPAALRASTRQLSGDELPDWAQVGFVTDGVPFVDPTRYLDWLLARYVELGGRLMLGQRVDTPAQLRRLMAAQSAAVAVNATGIDGWRLMGATASDERRAAERQRLRGGAGFYVLARAPWIRHGVSLDEDGGRMTYVIPRCNGVLLLGGTLLHSALTTPNRAQSDAIWQRARALVPELAAAVPLATGCGVRPVRDGGPLLALHSYQHDKSARLVHVVHAYGHGGSGYTMCWGVANDVVKLCQSIHSTHHSRF